MIYQIAATPHIFNNAPLPTPSRIAVIQPQQPPASPQTTGQQPHPGQWRHGAGLWRDYLAEPALPQLDRWLKHRLARSKQFGKRDRMIYADLLFNAMRFGYWAEFVLQHPQLVNGNSLPDESLLSFASRYASTRAMQQCFAKRCDSADDDTGSVAFLTLCHWRTSPDQPLPQTLQALEPVITRLRQQATRQPGSIWSLLWHGIPLSHLPAVSARSLSTHWTDRQIAQFLQAQDSRPPLWLRLNHADERDGVLRELEENYDVTVLQDGIAIDGDRGIFGLDCYKNGAIAVQDLASQQLAARVDCKPGERVWDACAGGGGKTLAIAARLGNKGSLWASDIRAHKLDEIKRRASLSRFYNIRTAVWNGDVPLQLPKEIARHGGFNWVLVDAPCSSSGTWRRNPDARLRSLDDDLPRLNALQLQLLTQASLGVRPDGKLVYGTCSFHNCENEDVVAAFLQNERLQNNGGWQIVEQTMLGCPSADSDTMFVAVLRRIADDTQDPHKQA
jgi:16S rRNA (cytosine967-C5)-methyltransferase